jgi:single-stranded DNA-binding protein
MQKILIIGYLGRDPELKYTPQGAVITPFTQKVISSLNE